MSAMYEFEVRTADGAVETWDGVDGPDACRRYAEAHPGVVVVAHRVPRFEFRVGMIRIEEPGVEYPKSK